MLLLVVEQQTCNTCQTYEYAPASYPFVFSQCYRPPFGLLIKKTSIVHITTRCGSQCGHFTKDSNAVAFYSTRYSQNLMLLSRIAMLNSGWSSVIDIRCTPRSHRGLLTMMDFMESFAAVTYGLTPGYVCFQMDDVNRYIQVLDLSMELGRQYENWTAAIPSQYALLRELQ